MQRQPSSKKYLTDVASKDIPEARRQPGKVDSFLFLLFRALSLAQYRTPAMKGGSGMFCCCNNEFHESQRKQRETELHVLLW